jgi:hypothetical protein
MIFTERNWKILLQELIQLAKKTRITHYDRRDDAKIK